MFFAVAQFVLFASSVPLTVMFPSAVSGDVAAYRFRVFPVSIVMSWNEYAAESYR